MKLNRNKGNLQDQLAKMLQAGMENVDTEQKTENKGVEENTLHANKQSGNGTNVNNEVIETASDNEKEVDNNQQQSRTPLKPKTRQAAKPAARQTTRTSTRSRRVSRQEEEAHQRLNAAQRHEVPDHNEKYAGEPIKSVGCRMPQSLYARMLQYKALNDSQLNRITLNDIIIEAVEKFMDDNQ